MSALQALLMESARARWPGALLGEPPGCDQVSLGRAGGSVTGRSAAARSEVMFSCWITDTRLPGSGTGFSANGLMSSTLGRLGRLMPTKASAQPASASAPATATPAARRLLLPVPSRPVMVAPVAPPCASLALAIGRLGLVLAPSPLGRRRRVPGLGQLGFRDHGQHHPRPLADAGWRLAVAQQTLVLGARVLRAARLLRRQAQELTGAEAPRAGIRGQIVEPILHFRKAGAVQ